MTFKAYVFARPGGAIILGSAYVRFVKRAKLRHIRFHDLRHSSGTLALQSGVDLKTVSRALGHSTISTTANTYLHAVESLHRDAAARIDALLGAAVSDALTATGEFSRTTSVPQRCHRLATQKKTPVKSSELW